MFKNGYSHILFSPSVSDSSNGTPLQQVVTEHTTTEQSVFIEDLKRLNDDLRKPRRAALNLMEDAVLSKEALRASEEKYRTLFDSMDEGYCILQMMYNDKGEANNWRFLEVNRAFELNNGLYNAEGKTIRELSSDIEPMWFEIYDNVAQTGEPLRFEEDSVALNRIFSLYAFCIGTPAERKVAVIFTDITERKHREQNQLMLSQISEQLLVVDSIEKTISRIAKKIGEYFDVAHCQFTEFKEANNTYTHRQPGIKQGLLR